MNAYLIAVAMLYLGQAEDVSYKWTVSGTVEDFFGGKTMKRWILTFAVGLALIGVGSARGSTLLFEGFYDSSGFTLAGDYQGSWIQWGIAPLGGTSTYPSNFVQGGSQSGNIFYGAHAKESDEAGAAVMTIILPDLTGYTDLQLTVALAAAEDVWEPTHRDSLHIIGGTTTTPPVVESIGPGFMPIPDAIDNFLPPSYPSSLVSSVYSTTLGVEFQDFTYPIAGNLKSLSFAFGSTAGEENVGIDSVTITGNLVSTVPEPASIAVWAMLAIGGLGSLLTRRQFLAN